MIFMVSMIRISSQNLFHKEIGSFSRKNLLFFFLGEGENYVVRQKKTVTTSSSLIGSDFRLGNIAYIIKIQRHDFNSRYFKKIEIFLAFSLAISSKLCDRIDVRVHLHVQVVQELLEIKLFLLIFLFENEMRLTLS